MNRWQKIIATLAAASLLAACAGRTAAGDTSDIDRRVETSAAPSSSAVEEQGQTESAPPDSASEEQEPRYIQQLVQQTILQFAQPDMDDYQKAKAAFDYMIETMSLIDPVGLELWRLREPGAQPPSFVENRSLSILLFRLGKCEDYAAALTMLLQGMGLEAAYVPGLTYSTQGELVDHAWTVAKIDGVWYHLDCQLEQNISRHGSIRYKYFMRGDATLAGSHRWGQNLINSGLLRQEQNEEIARSYTPPACPGDYPTPERRPCTLAESPDMEAIQAAIALELREFERENGPLEPLELNIVPPVFALEGYGPQD